MGSYFASLGLSGFFFVSRPHSAKLAMIRSSSSQHPSPRKDASVKHSASSHVVMTSASSHASLASKESFDDTSSYGGTVSIRNVGGGGGGGHLHLVCFRRALASIRFVCGIVPSRYIRLHPVQIPFGISSYRIYLFCL